MSHAFLGAHVSTAGGLIHAFARGRAIGCDALQIFVKSPNQWRAKPLAPEEARAFQVARVEAGRPPIVAHAAYLINLAAVDPELLAKSRAGLLDELSRGAAIGLDGVVVHPGAHLGRGVDAALTAVAESLDAILAELPPTATKVLLELTAGQGSVVGHTLEQLASIRSRSHAPERIAYCLDTCHAFAGGYELRTPAAVEDFLARVDSVLGFDLVACFHLNDSQGELGSKKDRHANIGRGRIGLEGFRRLLTEAKLARVPAVLETPLNDDERGHADDLVTLRGLFGERAASVAPPVAARVATPSPLVIAGAATKASAKAAKPKSSSKTSGRGETTKKAPKRAAPAAKRANPKPQPAPQPAARRASAKKGSSKGRTRAR